MNICKIHSIKPDGKPWESQYGMMYPSAEAVSHFLRQDETTGRIFWKTSPCPAVKCGQEAGSINRHGYRTIGLLGKYRLAHRVAWLLHFGFWPDQELDHINGIKDDNRISNLREVTHAENMQNRTKAMRSSSTGVLGVKPFRNGYIARIQRFGKRQHLGVFKTIEEASSAYRAAAITL